MTRHAIATALVAALVLLAGCTGGLSGTGEPGGTAADGSTATDAPSTATPADGTSDGNGTLNMYISDEQNAIGDFEHLNVTITRIGLQPADGEEGADSEGGTDDEDDGSEGEWVEYEVDDRTVDLTRLQGANATMLSSFDVPNGTYGKVFVHASEVNGTLKDGSDQRVKLPSGKLQLNSEFTVGDGESIDFVFDVTAVKAGQSGKYVLKPVVSESGTDVEIESADEDDDEDDESDKGDDADARTAALNASFVGDVTPGENATLVVTKDGSAVANATVSVDDRRVGTIDANGTLSLAVPADAEELEVTVTSGEAEAEVEVEFDEDDGEEDTETETETEANGERTTATE